MELLKIRENRAKKWGKLNKSQLKYFFGYYEQKSVKTEQKKNYCAAKFTLFHVNSHFFTFLQFTGIHGNSVNSREFT
jgi:hypothetical protein